MDDLERQLYQKVKQWCRNIQLLLLEHQSAIWEANPLMTIRREQGRVAELERLLVQGMQNSVLLRRHQAKLARS